MTNTTVGVSDGTNMNNQFHIGMTGTRNGMTRAQMAIAFQLLKDVKDGNPDSAIVLHQGDAVGADLEFHKMAVTFFDWWIEIHPPLNAKYRAYSERVCPSKKIIVNEPREYMARNRDIVDASEMMFGAPKEQDEVLRSGTWSAIRYTKKVNKPIHIIFPDGSVQQFNI